MAKSLKFGNVILCEFIAKGAGNKHTLVNVFSGDIVVSALPATIMLAVYAEYFPPDQRESQLTLQLNIDEEPIAEVGIAATLSPNSKVVSLVFQGLGISFQKEGTLIVAATADGYRKTTLLSKRIYQGPIPPGS